MAVLVSRAFPMTLISFFLLPHFPSDHRGTNLLAVHLQHHPSQHLSPEHSDQRQGHLEIGRLSFLREVRGDRHNGK